MKGKELIREPEREKMKRLAAYEMDYVIEAIDSPIMLANLKRFFSKKK